MNSIDLHRLARVGTPTDIRNAFGNGADVNAIDQFGKTALQSAIAWNKSVNATCLLDLGANPAIQDNDGATALHYAVEYGMREVIESILQHNMSALHTADRFGNQPLWTACTKPTIDYTIIEILVRNGADWKNKNKSNLSPFDIALEDNDERLLAIFS